jgi:hypothetical protein
VIGFFFGLMGQTFDGVRHFLGMFVVFQLMRLLIIILSNILRIGPFLPTHIIVFSTIWEINIHIFEHVSKCFINAGIISGFTIDTKIIQPALVIIFSTWWGIIFILSLTMPLESFCC